MTQPHEAQGSDGKAELGFDLPAPAKPSRTRLVAAGVVFAGVVGAAFLFGWWPKHRAASNLATETSVAADALLRVEVVTPKVLSSNRAVVLPGSIRPLEETVLYPRANGYVHKWFFDIGDRVKEGQLLAEIETPEIDQQIAQANAELARAQAGVLQSKAQSQYSNQALDRVNKLAPEGVASQQEVDKTAAQRDVDVSSIAVANANVGAMTANLRRLMQLKSFARVTAPFDGTVTARNVERGALVTPGTASPLFSVAQSDTVRVFVQVPQGLAAGVRADLPAKVSVREYPDRVFEGKVARFAGALDPATRTMNTEVRVPNPKGELFAGTYAEVALTLPTPHQVFEVPASALINDADGLRVAVVDAQEQIHQVKVVIERDTGATLEIAIGLTGTERVVKLANPALLEGRKVSVSAAAAPAAPAGSAPAPAGSAK